jgi:hypothetical protein
MVRNQDFKNNKKEVRRIQDATYKFFKNHIQTLFSHRVPIDDSIIVTDETDIRFLDDKYFKFDDFLLKKYDIKSNEILLKMSYRAKIDKSINDKNMINPTTTTLNSIHDL